jgi:hypothetical protein
MTPSRQLLPRNPLDSPSPTPYIALMLMGTRVLSGLASLPRQAPSAGAARTQNRVLAGHQAPTRLPRVPTSLASRARNARGTSLLSGRCPHSYPQQQPLLEV